MIQLRPAEQSEVPILTQIKKRAFSHEFRALGFTPEDMIAPEWHVNMMKKSLYFTIVYNEICIGGVNIFQAKYGYYLCSLFIDTDYQNRGIGTQVLEMLEQQNDDGNKWCLETPAMSTQNHHFYEKCGYTYVRDMAPEGAPEGFSLRVYEKYIASAVEQKRMLTNCCSSPPHRGGRA